MGDRDQENKDLRPIQANSSQEQNGLEMWLNPSPTKKKKKKNCREMINTCPERQFSTE
jgi:Pyruvate/2-oxoacid:ferredoxin oxidoreductase delta subunit